MDQNKTQTGTVTHQYTPTNRKSVQYLKASGKLKLFFVSQKDITPLTINGQ